MTVKELYDWAEKKGVENSEIEIQYGDDGGYYSGTRSLEEDEISISVCGSVIIL